MSDVVDIAAFSKKFKDLAEIQEYAVRQYQALANADKKINELNYEIAHLQKLLADVVTPGSPSTLLPEDERIIADLQLNRLKQTAMTRDLTLEETKRYDLLVKNKFLSKGQATEIVETLPKGVPDSVPDAELIRLIKGDNGRDNG